MRLALLGDPVAHSRSPAIHAAALRAVGIEGSYEARCVDREGLIVAMDELRAGSLDGANVTMPHKGVAAALADRLEPAAVSAGAANTLWRVDGEIWAANTDVDALRQLIAPMGDHPVMVLGSGGAARAALVALGERRVTIVARNPGAAAAAVVTARSGAAVGEWGESPAGAIVVNATPLGMRGEQLPVAVDLASGLVDMAYGDGPTAAVIAARERGIPVVDGIDVLVAQAAISFELWTGSTVAPEILEQAARAR